ncbi:hypothetical protein Btru_013298 [Bulinus truncatus]|nr:hypothetical protein Btru_013298 [Bulinus truncatus]
MIPLRFLQVVVTSPLIARIGSTHVFSLRTTGLGDLSTGEYSMKLYDCWVKGSAMSSHHLMNAAAVVLFSWLCVQVSFTQPVCEACSCQISALNNPQAIHTLDLICNSGSITWFGADGALRLELNPLFQGPSRACFLVDSDNSQVKVTQEIVLAKNYKLHQIETKVLTTNATNGEFCVSSKMPESLHLFIESFVIHNIHSLPKVTIHYDIEKLDSSMSTVYEECRPCTKEEVLDAYCSMDYAVIANLNEVKDNPEMSMSVVTLSVKQVIHQQEPEMFYRTRRSDQFLTGNILVPTQCGIQKSAGDFLITGRRRLRSLTLKCAINLLEWRELQHLTECSHDKPNSSLIQKNYLIYLVCRGDNFWTYFLFGILVSQKKIIIQLCL